LRWPGRAKDADAAFADAYEEVEAAEVVKSHHSCSEEEDEVLEKALAQACAERERLSNGLAEVQPAVQQALKRLKVLECECRNIAHCVLLSREHGASMASENVVAMPWLAVNVHL